MPFFCFLKAYPLTACKLKLGDLKGALLDTDFAMRDAEDNVKALFRQGQVSMLALLLIIHLSLSLWEEEVKLLHEKFFPQSRSSLDVMKMKYDMGVLGVSGQSWNSKGSLCGSTTSIKATMYLSLQFKQRPFAHRSWASTCIRRHGADGRGGRDVGWDNCIPEGVVYGRMKDGVPRLLFARGGLVERRVVMVSKASWS
ncbi:unnamed protein product [Prunus armeniaca]